MRIPPYALVSNSYMNLGKNLYWIVKIFLETAFFINDPKGDYHSFQKKVGQNL